MTKQKNQLELGLHSPFLVPIPRMRWGSRPGWRVWWSCRGGGRWLPSWSQKYFSAFSLPASEIVKKENVKEWKLITKYFLVFSLLVSESVKVQPQKHSSTCNELCDGDRLISRFKRNWLIFFLKVFAFIADMPKFSKKMAYWYAMHPRVSFNFYSNKSVGWVPIFLLFVRQLRWWWCFSSQYLYWQQGRFFPV